MSFLVPDCTDLAMFSTMMIFSSLVAMAVGACYAIKHRRQLKKKDSSSNGDVGHGPSLPTS